MNKHLRRFLVLVVGCSLVMGSATFAAENKTTGTIPATAKTEMVFDEDWDDVEAETVDLEMPQTGAQWVKELKEHYSLTSAEEGKLTKLFDEVLKFEKGLDFGKMTDKDWEDLEKKTENIWKQIDEVLAKYDQAEMLKEEIPALDQFIDEHGLDKSKLSKDELAKITDYHNKIVAAQRAKDGDKLFAAYDALYEWADSELAETVFVECEDAYFDDEDLTSDFEDAMTDEDYEKMMVEDIKAFDVDEFVKELGVKVPKEDLAKIKSIHADMLKAANANDIEKIYTLYDAFDQVMYKYYEMMDDLYKEEIKEAN